jgi:ribulose-5-phosphate 4-epimerase/fuculose-1-phosphate aldolase
MIPKSGNRFSEKIMRKQDFNRGETPVPMSLAEAREVLARANHMIAHEGVLDAFGHVTMRHPSDPGRFLMSRSRGPELVQPEDIHEFTLDSQIIKPIKQRLYSERVIHGEIYKARPEVMAVCHHHAPSMLPFCITGMKMKPLNHLGATMGAQVPVWDSRHEFGNTNLLVAKPEVGASLARALGPYWTVLMRRHGATVAGRTLEEVTFRTIYTARNAAAQIQAEMLGAGLEPLNAEETELAANHNLAPGPVMRAWEYWSVRLDKAEGTWGPAKPAAPARMSRKAPAKKKRSRRGR